MINPPPTSATFDLGPVEAVVALEAGPRILGYRRPGGPNVFAALEDEAIEHPAIGEFRFLGGHRLWRAPELPALTYQRDHNIALSVTERDDGFTLVGVPESDGLTKTIRLSQHGRYSVVEHELHNQGDEMITCAPWAITQLTPGGQAFLPQSHELADPDGVLPNRHIVAWPYTDLSRPEIEFRHEAVIVHGSTQAAAAKVGQPNRRGWIAYYLDDEVFVKWSPLHHDDHVYVDFGATVQCYRDERFVELETLGPLTTLEPREKTMHREIWLLIDTMGEPVSDVLASLPVSPGVPNA